MSLFSRDLDVTHGNCLSQLLLELDRLTRPGGYVVVSGRGLAAMITPNVVQPLGWQDVSASAGPGGGPEQSLLIFKKLGGTFGSVPATLRQS